jgi:hypothetical protein
LCLVSDYIWNSEQGEPLLTTQAHEFSSKYFQSNAVSSLTIRDGMLALFAVA